MSIRLLTSIYVLSGSAKLPSHSCWPTKATLVVAVVGIVVLTAIDYNVRRKMPPGPRGWPLIGSMLEIPRIVANPDHLKQLVERYGPIITLWNGSVPVILATSSKIAHEALIEQGSVFSSRPAVRSMRSMAILTNGFKTINFSPYGPHWRATRRNLVSGILSPSMLSSYAGEQEEAVERLLARLKEEGRLNGGTVGVLANVRHTLFAILSFMCFGRHLEESQVRQLDALMKEATTLLRSAPGDLVPVLRLFETSRHERKLREFLSRQNEFISGLIAETCKQEDPRAGPVSYLDTLHSLRERGDVDIDPVTLSRELFIAGNDTTTNCVEWSIANLIKHPRVQEKLFSEIACRTKGGRRVRVDDIAHLPYLHAVVKETLRRHPPVYVSAPHALTRATQLAGYDIPANATLFVHLRSISNDPETWADPEEFVPERFVGCNNLDMPGFKHIISMIPFSAGRRMCPGKHLGMLHVHLILANLVQAFVWRTEAGEMLDMSPDVGFSVGMKRPLRAAIRERCSVSS